MKKHHKEKQYLNLDFINFVVEDCFFCIDIIAIIKILKTSLNMAFKRILVAFKEYPPDTTTIDN